MATVTYKSKVNYTRVAAVTCKSTYFEKKSKFKDILGDKLECFKAWIGVLGLCIGIFQTKINPKTRFKGVQQLRG